ncbi:MAG: hypothetical protein ABFS10_04765 [Bacteroidota bacterium]
MNILSKGLLLIGVALSTVAYSQDPVLEAPPVIEAKPDIVTAPGRGGKLGMEAGFGVAANRMDDLKQIQEMILEMHMEEYQVDGRVISSFPAYTMASFGIKKQLNRSVRIGALYAFSTTGGRSNYTDFTGSLSTDIQATSHRIGAYGSYAVTGSDRWDLSVYGRLDINYTRVDINTFLYVLGYSNGMVDQYSSVSPNGTAGVELFYHFNGFSVGLDGGYLVDMQGNLSNKDTGNDLTNPNDPQRVMTTDWTGWRAMAKVLIWLQ